MTEFNRFQEKVRETLLKDWDPIGIGGVEAASDEYDQYVKPIAGMIIAEASVSTLSSYLVGVEVESMGLSGNHDRARSVATKLQGLRTLSGST